MKSYLTNRQFWVQIEDKFSEVKQLTFLFHKEAFWVQYFLYAMLAHYRNSSWVTIVYLDMLMITPS